MIIIGYILILIGAFWIMSRLLNQKIQFRGLKDRTIPIWRYLLVEGTMGFGFGILLIYFGYKLIS